MEQHQHNQSLQDQAYTALRSKIIYAELRPGTRLSAIGLEKETGIGRTDRKSTRLNSSHSV